MKKQGVKLGDVDWILTLAVLVLILLNMPVNVQQCGW